MKKLSLLFFDMFRLALFVIGGGYAIIAAADTVFSRKRKWIEEGELVSAIPIFQMVPGIMAGHAAVYVGRKVAGFCGSLVALTAVALPSLVIFCFVSAGYEFIPSGNGFVESSFVGLRASLAGIVFAIMCRTWKKNIAGVPDLFLFLAVFSVLVSTSFPAVLIVAAAVGAGLLKSVSEKLKNRFCSFSFLPMVFLKYGLVAFGGGYSLVPLYLQDFVGDGAAYLNVPTSEFANIMAFTQITPGPIGLNAATFFGYRMSGVAGAVLSTVFLLLPGFAILSSLLHYLEKGKEGMFVKNIMSFVRPVSVALMAAAAVSFAGMCIWDVSGAPHRSWCTVTDFNFNAVALTIASVAAVVMLRGKAAVTAIVLCSAFAASALRAGEITRAGYPDADCVYVDSREEVEYSSDGTYVSVEEEKVKILTEKGMRSQREFSLSYSARYGKAEILFIEVTDAKGNVRKIDFASTLKDATDNSSMSANIYDPLDRVLTCQVPGLQVGDTVHTKVKRTVFKPRVKGHFSDISVFEWSVPMVRKELRVKAPAEKPLATIGIENAIGNVSYTKKELSDGGMMHVWTATNSPQAFPEPSMPPLYTQVQVLRVSTVKSWEDISSWYWQLCLPHMEKASPALTNKVFEIGKDVDKIFRWVAENIRYMGLTMEDTSPGYAPHDVDITFANRYGVCRDKAALLAAMLRIAGFDAYPVLIHAGAKMDEKVPVPFFNHAIVAIRDKSVPCGYRLMDPTNETSRDLMPSYLGGKSFLVACPEGEKLKVSPVTPATDNIVEIETAGSVGKDGTAYLKSEISFGGVNDGIYRGAFLRRKKDMMRPFIERIVASSLKGAELISFEIKPENLHDMTKPLHLSLSIKVPECSFERKTSYELSIPFVSKAIGAASFILSGETSLEKRKYPLEVFSTAAVSERLTLNLDFGAGVPVFIPDSSEIKGKYGYFNTCKVTDGKLVATRKVAVNDIEFSPKEYSALREDMKRSDSHERKNIVFAKNALANANVHIVKNVTSYNVASSGSWISTNEVHQKILTYDGKKRSSELIFNFNPAWKNIKLLYATVSNVNGQVSHVESKEISVMDEDWVSSAPRYKPSKKLIINLPSVEVGSVIKYAVETAVSNSPAPFYLTYYRDVKVPTDEKVFSIDGITERLVEPKVVSDENMQPEARLWRNVQIFSRATKSDTFAYLRKMAKTDKVFHEPVNKILAKSKQKQDCSAIRIVRDWMSENIRVAGPSLYESSYDAHMTDPKTVLNEGYASRMDYMRTMCALLKGAGEDVDIVFSAYDASSVKSSAELDMNKHFNPHAFKYPLCRVKTQKGDVFIGLENKYTPIGSTSFDGAHFIDLKTGKFGVVRALAGLEEKYKTSYLVRIRENGSVDIDVTNEIFGYEAGQYRRKYSEMLPEDFNRHHQTLVGNIAQSATATGPLFADVKSYPFVRKMSVFIPEFATLSKDEISLSIPWLSDHNQFASSTVRKTPFCIDSEAPNTINVKIIFPKGYTGIEHLPESFRFGNPLSRDGERPWLVQTAKKYIGASGDEKGRLIIEIEKTHDVPRSVMFGEEWFGFFKYRSHVETGKGANSVSAKKACRK